MNIRKSFFGLILGSVVSLPAFAGSSASGVTITGLQISEAYGGTFVFIGLSSQPSGAPACQNSSWQYTLSFSAPGATQLYAMLLTAYTSQSPVDVSGAGSCNEVGFVESLQGLQLNKPQ